MREKRYILIRATVYDIEEPEFFDTYDEAYEQMKRQYEIWSKDCSGELNDDDAWCTDAYGTTNWKIFEIQI